MRLTGSVVPATMWPVCVGYDGVYRASAGPELRLFSFFFGARFWTLSGSYTQHKDVDSYTNTRIDSGVCPGRAGWQHDSVCLPGFGSSHDTDNSYAVSICANISHMSFA